MDTLALEPGAGRRARPMDVAFASHRGSNSTISTFLEAIGLITGGSLGLSPALGAGGGGQCCR
jgi:hypothetical protein